MGDWNPAMKATWARYRELAVTVGVDENLLAEIDRLIGDDVRATRAPDSWRHDTAAALRRVSEAIIARVAEGNVPAKPFYEYRRGDARPEASGARRITCRCCGDRLWSRRSVG